MNTREIGDAAGSMSELLPVSKDDEALTITPRISRKAAAGAAAAGAVRYADAHMWVVLSEKLNVREDPSTDASRLGMVFRGDRLTPIKFKEDGLWMQVPIPPAAAGRGPLARSSRKTHQIQSRSLTKASLTPARPTSSADQVQGK